MPTLFARLAHHYRWQDLLGMSLTLAAIVVLAWLGHVVYAEHRMVSLVWPASGVALGVLLRFGLSYWPALLLGGMLASLVAGNPWTLALPTALGGLLEALFAWYLLRQPHLDFDLELHRPGDFMRLALVGVLAANVGAIIGGLSLLLNGLLPSALILQKVMQWWQGDLLGLVVFTPMVLVWSRGIDMQRLRSWRLLECLACLGLSWLAGQIILLDWWQPYFTLVAYNYWLFLFVAWAAVRCGPQLVALILVMFLAQGLLGATLGVGSFAQDAQQTGMENFWFFNMLLGGVGFSLASLVTEQGVLAASLRQEQQFLSDIIDSLPGNFYLYDDQGGLVRWNRTLAQTTGYSDAELLGKQVLEFIAPEDRGLISERVARVFSAGETVVEAQLLTQSGQKIPYHFTGRRSLINGRYHLVGVGEDISERQRIEQQVRDSEERYRMLFEHGQTYSMIVDREGVVLMINRNNARLLGGEPADFIGASVYELFPENIRTSFRQRVSQILALGPSDEGLRFEDDFWLHGREHWVDSYLCPARNAAGEVYGLQLVALDITERKEAELKLRQNESRYRQLFENTATNITIIDGEGRILMLNAANARMLGGRPEDFIGRTLQELDPEHADGFVERYRRILNERQAQVVDESFPLSDGVHWFRAHLQPLFDLDGQAVAVQVMAFDITDRKQMELALQQSEAVWRFAFEGAGDAVWDWDVATDRIEYSPRWKELLGYDEDDQINTIEEWRALLHPDDAQQVRANYQQILISGCDRATQEVRTRCKDGSWRWVITRSMVVDRNADGVPTRILGVNTDVTERRQMEEALRRSEELWKFALEGAGDTVWDFDMAHGLIYQSPRYKALLGYTAEDGIETLEDWHRLIHPDDMPLIMDNHRAIYSGVTQMSSLEVRVRCKDGSWKWILSRGMVMGRDEQGRPLRVVGTNTDTTERKQMEQSLRRSEEYWKFALEGAGDAVWDWDIETGRVNYSARWWEMMGYPRRPGSAGGVSAEEKWRLAVHPDDQLAADANALRLLEQGSSTAELRMRCRDGSYKWMLMRGMVVARDENGRPLRVVGTNADITALKDHQHQLEHLAHFDTLTQLPNRVLLAYRLQQAMTQCQRRQQSLAVVYLDLDGFKIVNDSHGHDVGDELLVQVAQRMKAALREGDTLARIGGDEFIAVLTDLDQAQDCDPVLERLLQAASEPVVVAERNLRVSASLGVTLYPGDGSDAEQLIRHADQAMYQAKQAGKNRYHLFDVDRDAAVQLLHETISEIRRGLGAQEFVLHYQPKVNMKSGQMVGLEALIRWQHPQHGWLQPDSFLPQIEEQEVCVDMGEWVIDSALTQMAAWQAQGLRIPVSVNITAYHMRRHDFTAMLAAALQRHPEVEPQLLELEILETGVFDDLDEVASIMDACHQLGVSFALDDFGTGYSSLTYLKRLPAGLLKIDRSFVCDMLEDPDDLSIVEGVVGLAHAFSRRAIAEGVESAAHGELLLQLGCELAQGYGIARPMPAAELAHWLAHWRPDPSWQRCAERPLLRDNLPLVFSEVRHRHWLRGIETWLSGQRPQAAQLALDECPLTHWLRAYGVEHYGHLEGWQEMVALHERLHGAGQTLCQSHELPPQRVARAGLGVMQSLHEQLNKQLRQLVQAGE